VSKKVPVVKITTPGAGAELPGVPVEATVALADVAAAMREGLLAFSTAAGLVVMRQMLDAELASIVGTKHAHRRRLRRDPHDVPHHQSRRGLFEHLGRPKPTPSKGLRACPSLSEKRTPIRSAP
jgi:hypothetical protein